MVQYTCMVVHTNMLGYFRKAHQKVLKFFEGKELFPVNMAGTHEIENTLFAVPKGNHICGNTVYCPYQYAWLFPESLWESVKFFEGKELFPVNMAGAHEIQNTLMPNTKGKSHLWKHFNLHKWKTNVWIDADVAVSEHCDSVVKFVGGTSNVSKHMKRHHPSHHFFGLLPHFLTN